MGFLTCGNTYLIGLFFRATREDAGSVCLVSNSALVTLSPYNLVTDHPVWSRHTLVPTPHFWITFNDSYSNFDVTALG